jgi:uncharacterized protein (TIGR00288 family)
MNNDTFAIFVDSENCDYKLYPKLDDMIRNRGNIVIKRVYGDISDEPTKIWKKTCEKYGIELVHFWKNSGKNIADIKIAIDIMELIYNFKHITHFVIMTGDSDFKEIANKLLSYGKYVIIVSGYEKRTSNILKNFCNEFIIIENEKKEIIEDSITKSEILEIIQNIIEEQQNINLGVIKKKLLNVDPMFNENNFGFKKFSEFIESLDNTLHVDKKTNTIQNTS